MRQLNANAVVMANLFAIQSDNTSEVEVFKYYKCTQSVKVHLDKFSSYKHHYTADLYDEEGKTCGYVIFRNRNLAIKLTTSCHITLFISKPIEHELINNIVIYNPFGTTTLSASFEFRINGMLEIESRVINITGEKEFTADQFHTVSDQIDFHVGSRLFSKRSILIQSDESVIAGRLLAMDEIIVSSEKSLTLTDKSQLSTKKILLSSNDTCIEGLIGADQSFHVEGDSTLKLSSGCMIKTPFVKLKCDQIAILSANINADDTIIIEAERTVDTLSFSTLRSKTILVKSQAVMNEAHIICEKLGVKSSGITLLGNNIQCSQHIIFDTKEIEMLGLIDSHGQLEIKTASCQFNQGDIHFDDLLIRSEKLTLDNRSKAVGTKKADISTDTCSINGILGSQDLMLVANQKASVEKDGKIYANGHMNIEGNSMCIAGSVKAEAMLQLSFDQTVTSSIGSVVAGHQVNIVASVVTNFLGMLSGKNTTITSLVYFNGGATATSNLTTSNLVQLDIGINLPHLKSIERVMRQLKCREIDRIATDFMAYLSQNKVNSSLKLISIAAQLTSYAFPQYAGIANLANSSLSLAYNVFLLGCNSKQVICQTERIYTLYSKDQLHWRHVIPLIAQIKDIALGLAMSAQSTLEVAQQLPHAMEGSVAPSSSKQLLETTGSILATALSGMSRTDSLFTFKAGLNGLGGMDIERAILSYSAASFNAGVSSTSMNLFKHEFYNMNLFLNLQRSAVSLQEAHTFTITRSESQHASQINLRDAHKITNREDVATSFLIQDKDSSLKANTLSIIANNFQQDGQVSVALAATIQTDDCTIKQAATLEVSDATIQAKNKLTMQGETVISGTVLLKADELNLSQTSKISSKQDNTELHVEATHTSMTGNIHDVSKLSVHTDQLDNPYDLVQHRGSYAAISPTKQLSLDIDQSLNMSESLSRTDIDLSIKTKQLTISHALQTTHQLYLEAKEGSLNLQYDLSADSLYLTATETITSDNHLFHATQTLHIRSGKSYINYGGHLTANEIFIEAQTGNIENLPAQQHLPPHPTAPTLAESRRRTHNEYVAWIDYQNRLHSYERELDRYNKIVYSQTPQGGDINASSYVQLSANEGYIKNVADSKDRKAHYDVMKIWDVSTISGGDGKNHDGIGVVLSANQVFNDGSSITASGDIKLYGKHGIESSPRVHTYVSKNKTEHGFLGFSSKHKIEHSTQLLKPVLSSTNGRIAMLSQSGDVTLTATNVISRLGSDIYVQHGDINLFDIVTTFSVSKTQSAWWGVSNDKQHATHEFSVPTTISNLDRGLTRLHTIEAGNINLIGAWFVTPGKTEIQAQGDVNYSASVLHHLMQHEHRGFSISAFGIPIVGDNAFNVQLFHPDPGYEQIHQLLNSDTDRQKAMNGLTTALNLATSGNQLYSAWKSNSLATALTNRYLGISLQPQAGLNINRSTEKFEYETVAPTGMMTDELAIQATGDIDIKGVSIVVTGDASFAAANIKQSGTKLNSHYSSSTVSCDIAFSPQSAATPEVGLSFSSIDSKSSLYTPQIMQVHGTLSIIANTWSLTNSTVTTNSLVGSVDTLNARTNANYISSSQHAASLSTNGNVSFSHDSSKLEYIDIKTSIQAHNAITDSSFHVDNMNMTGAILKSDAVVSITPKTMHIYDVKNSDKHDQIGFAFNVKNALDLLHQLSSAKFPMNELDLVVDDTSSQLDPLYKLNYTDDQITEIVFPDVSSSPRNESPTGAAQHSKSSSETTTHASSYKVKATSLPADHQPVISKEAEKTLYTPSQKALIRTTEEVVKESAGSAGHYLSGKISLFSRGAEFVFDTQAAKEAGLSGEKALADATTKLSCETLSEVVLGKKTIPIDFIAASLQQSREAVNSSFNNDIKILNTPTVPKGDTFFDRLSQHLLRATQIRMEQQQHLFNSTTNLGEKYLYLKECKFLRYKN